MLAVQAGYWLGNTTSCSAWLPSWPQAGLSLSREMESREAASWGSHCQQGALGHPATALSPAGLNEVKCPQVASMGNCRIVKIWTLPLLLPTRLPFLHLVPLTARRKTIAAFTRASENSRLCWNLYFSLCCHVFYNRRKYFISYFCFTALMNCFLLFSPNRCSLQLFHRKDYIFFLLHWADI